MWISPKKYSGNTPSRSASTVPHQKQSRLRYQPKTNERVSFAQEVACEKRRKHQDSTSENLAKEVRNSPACGGAIWQPHVFAKEEVCEKQQHQKD